MKDLLYDKQMTCKYFNVKQGVQGAYYKGIILLILYFISTIKSMLTLFITITSSRQVRQGNCNEYP